MEQNSFIKLWRSLIKWQWYDDINTCRLFIHLLLMARYEDGYSYGVEEKRGQYVTGRKKLAEETSLSEQEVRTSLNKLKSTNEITIKPTNKFSVITIVKYNDYQEFKGGVTTNTTTNGATNEQPTINQQSTNNQPLPNKERKKELKNKEDDDNMRAQESDFEAISWRKVFDAYEDEFCRPLTAIEIQTIHDFAVSDDLKILALEKARLAGVMKIGYIKAIVERWMQGNIQTVDEANAADEQFKKQQADKQSNKPTGRSRIIEPVPVYRESNPEANEDIDFEKLEKMLDSM